MPEVKNPGVPLRMLYVSAGQPKVIKVWLKSGMTTVGDETWKVNRNCSFPPGGKFDIICVQGQSEAVPVWGLSVLTTEQLNAIANNNLLVQVHGLSQGGKTPAISWVQVGLTGLMILAILGVGFKLSGDFDDLHAQIAAAHPPPTTTPSPSSNVNVQHNPQTGTLGQNQGSGPP